MNHRSLLIIGTLFLVACAPIGSNQMMGNGGMMGGNQAGGSGFLPGQGTDISTLPEAKPSMAMNVQDGQTISLNPTMVRKVINGSTGLTTGGREIAMYGYNGQIPGPLLRVKQGATFTVHVTNNIDLPTSVHWHGIRLDSQFDGAIGISQKEIAPGGSFTYTVKVPDEGIYWYHTHVREDLQQPMGLYGAILVSPSEADTYSSVDREETIILNDLLVGSDGTPVPYGRANADHTLMGRFGNVFLVNGSEPRPLEAGLGSIVRFSILNASNTRTYRVVEPKGSILKIVGGDGGRYEKEFLTDSYTLSPSERVIVEVYFWDDGVNHGTPSERTVSLVEAGPPEKPIPVLSATIVGGVVGNDRLNQWKQLRTNNDVIQSMNALRSAFDKAPDHTLVLDLNMMGNGMMGGHGGMMGGIPADGIEWEDTMGMMNMNMMGNMMQWKMVDQETGATNDKIVYNAQVGDRLAIRIINKNDAAHPMQHPIHFHGQRFLVLSDNGVKNENFVWKDTVLVPAGHTVDILLDVSNPGDWMFHCHIAEHLGNGMMGLLRVLP